MQRNSNSLLRPRTLAMVAAAWTLTGSSVVFGQGLFSTAANVIAASGDAAPGLPAGVNLGGSGAFETGVMDDTGAILFRARLTGTGVVAQTERAYFYGSTRAGLQLVLRSGDPEPSGTLPGVTMNTATGQGLSGSVRIAANGTMMIAGNLAGTGSTADDTAIYVGTPGAFQIWMREGDLAPGTAGATLTSSFNSLSHQSSGLNSNGWGWITSTLAGGDVVGTTNNSALFAGPVGGLQLVARKGDVAPNGATLAGVYAGFIGQMNEANQVFFDVSYAIGTGSPAVTADDDRAIWMYTPGVGVVELIREGDPVTGMPGVTYSGLSTSPFNSGATAFNDSGEFCSRVDIAFGSPAIAKFSTSGDQILVQAGDPVPAVSGASIATFSNTSVLMNNAGTVAFQGQMGGAVLPADDTGIFSTHGGVLNLIAREGDVGPGVSWTFGSTMGQFMLQNNAGQVVFHNSMATGTGNVSTVWGWTPGVGLQLLAAGGDLIEVQPGVFKPLGSSGGIQFNNGACRPLSFGDDGTLSYRLNFDDGSGANATVKLAPPPTSVVYCTAGTSTNGCVPSIGASGTPSVAASSGFSIDVANVEGNRQGLVFYGVTGRAALPWASGSTSFLCVKTPTQRTGVLNSGGTDGACDGALSQDWLAYLASNPAALGAPFSAGTMVNAQAWYRDPPAPKTTNLSDALEFVTVP